MAPEGGQVAIKVRKIGRVDVPVNVSFSTKSRTAIGNYALSFLLGCYYVI